MWRNTYLVGTGVGVALLAVLAIGGSNAGVTPSPPQPAAAEAPSYPPIDGINECRRLVVTRQQVASALGFAPAAPSPSNPTYLGCMYGLPDRTQVGGFLVVSASEGFAAPLRSGSIRHVKGIGDAALFTPRANLDFHWVGGEADASSMLQVRIGDLVLRFLGGSYDASRSQHYHGLDLPALRRLAESALTSRAWF